MSKSHLSYVNLYHQWQNTIDEKAAPLLNAPRAHALQCLEKNGFPSKKVERYRYIDLDQLFAVEYGLNVKRIPIPVRPHDAFRCDVPNLSTQLFFVENDEFYQQELPKAPLPEGVFVGSLRQAALQHPEWLEGHYAQIANMEQDAPTALNTLFVQDGVMVYLPKNVVVERPIQIINLLRADVDLMVNRRVLIVAEEGSKATVLFCDHAMDQVKFLTTQVAEVYAAKHACLNIYDLETTHQLNTRITNTYIQQEDDSEVNIDTITLHCGTTRNQLDLKMAGDNATAHVGGFVIADEEQMVDTNTVIEHAAKGGKSHELYKYDLDDKAQGAFAGRILVQPGADKTESHENNANMISSPQARMYAQPILEIYADDVRCDHGSTIGQLNEQALFYMQQRGIPLAEARILMRLAFVGEAVEQIKCDALRDRLHYLVEKRFRGELSKCEGCAVCATAEKTKE